MCKGPPTPYIGPLYTRQHYTILLKNKNFTTGDAGTIFEVNGPALAVKLGKGIFHLISLMMVYWAGSTSIMR